MASQVFLASILCSAQLLGTISLFKKWLLINSNNDLFMSLITSFSVAGSAVQPEVAKWEDEDSFIQDSLYV